MANPMKKPTSADVRHIFRNLDDQTVADILALQPSHRQLEEAATRLNVGAEEMFAGRGPEDAVVARIVDLVGRDEIDPDEP